MSAPRHFNVLVLGGGFAGVYCAQRLLKRLKGHGKSVAIIASENHMVFQPMLAEVVGGSLAPRHVVNPLRLLCKGADVFRGTVSEVDLDKKRVVMNGGIHSPNVEVTFDHIMLSLGAAVNLSRTPGMAEHALLVRNVGDAMKLRATIISRLEEANLIADVTARRALLSFVVVGGGYSGVEVAGQMIDMMHSICKFYEFVKPEDFSVTLIHSGDKVLQMLSGKLAEYTAQTLANMGVKLMFKCRVKSVTACSVALEDGRKVAASTVVCTVGNAPHPLIIKLGEKGALPVEKGHVVVEDTGRVVGKENVWASGDCSQFPMAGGGKCPETAQFAYRQGINIGDNIAAVLTGGTMHSFTFKGLGELASIGHRTAVAEIMGLRFSGFIAWFMWRTIYLMKLPGLDRKLRVMAEWTFDLFFPRDINLLTPQYSTPLEETHLEPGDPLFHHGEPAYSFYAVQSGRVDITDKNGDIVKSATAGDHFGERALMEDHVWRYDATAKEPSTLVAISDRTFQKLLVIDSFKKLLLRTKEIYDTTQEIEGVLAQLPERCRSGMAADIMMANVASISELATLTEAITTFQKERHSSYPVVDANGCVSGLLRRADCYDWMKHHAMTPATTVRDLPHKKVLFFKPDMPLPEVFSTLIRTGASKGVVVDGGQKLLGLLTFYDLLGCPPEEKAAEPVAVPAM
jgi:NADH:ubiquinone reductase (H+-translocating)